MFFVVWCFLCVWRSSVWEGAVCRNWGMLEASPGQADLSGDCDGGFPLEESLVRRPQPQVAAGAGIPAGGIAGPVSGPRYRPRRAG